ncbi:DNA -binding domain-containing protein [Bradyrhizobium sp. RDT10]
MKTPPLDPDVADSAPDDPVLTGYDEQHLVTYWRLLDAETDGADWKEVARMVLYIDPDREPARARNAFDNHLARAKWMADHGYRDLLRAAARPNSKNLSIRIRN